jgi:hypothetical protein
MVRDTPPYGHAPTYQISLTYLEKQKCYDPDKKILFKKTIIWPWVQRSRSHKVIMVRDTPPYGHSPSNEGRHIGLVWFFLLPPPLLHLLLLLLLSEACPGHNIFVFRDRSMIFGMWVHDHKAGSERSGRKNQTKTICLPSFEGET